MKQISILLALLPALAWADFKLSSADVPAETTVAEKHVYVGYGCNGGNQSPALQWSGVPEGTKSLALVVHDPDAPVAGGWYHWVVYDLPSTVNSLPTNAGSSVGDKLPKGARSGRTSFEGNNFGGPCPPVGHGRHRYNFTLYALKVPKLAIEQDTPPAEAERRIRAASVAHTGFTVYYAR
ncbi:YbhB/YbcL family Raf kinase inhibitor-like protein [Chitiniphilus purpureus]|uniref:YbhB/YbcL family Raf kinase inhibitor-like protein n=1 Tax=Chitiniphilus purpureus TaxID=2981137 RepID=A0ABY6DMQ7_9NEIS|nr:YbhB/YbcL family Raf kinase inhibitor-like protein [Chitiniphilus sp. CD1]UXY15634.1 YbhB/YbcL family Raf kinase inhibitor-like protein [Chitiniphilus sp. CD1]